MSKSLPHLIRDGYRRPREAARYLLDLDLQPSVIVQAALLLVIINTLSLVLLYNAMERYSPEPIQIIQPPLLIGAFVQLLFVAICSYVVKLLSPAFGNKVSFAQSATIFIWFNLLQLCGAMAALFVVMIFGLLAFFVPIIPMVWTIWALGKYWAELVENKSNFIGFLLVVVAILITLPILGVLVSLLGLPGVEIVQNV